MQSSSLSVRTELHRWCNGVVDRGSSPVRVKLKTIELVLVASLLRIQQIFDWIGIRLMCTSGMKCHPDTIELNLFSQWKIAHLGVRHHSLTYYFSDGCMIPEILKSANWKYDSVSPTATLTFTSSGMTGLKLRQEVKSWTHTIALRIQMKSMSLSKIKH